MEQLTDSFEKLASGLWLEGLAIDYRRNIVWYSDVIGGGVHALLPDGSVESIDPSRMWTGGLLVNDDGAVSSGAGGIRWNNLALDRDGNLWITGFQSDHFVRIRPDGTQLPSAKVPAEAITQMRFGGADMRDLYLTAVSPTAGESLKNGVLPTEHTSFLYRGRSTLPGLPIPPIRFQLG